MLEKIVAEMPKAENPHPNFMGNRIKWVDFDRGVEAQCKLLAEQGWRKVPSEDELKERLLNSSQFLEEYTVNILVEELHRWLLEGE